ncbi:MAG TPA: hypothetical protein VLE97_05890 [Gaiellaceae bacterium]|nr:hypothetical protein [Gaiellaceae bacterium]
MKQLGMLVVLLALAAACHNADVDEATKEANAYAKHFQNVTSVECNASDSDGDGYVSCTIFRADADPVPIACGAENWCVANCAKGCKMLSLPSSKPRKSSSSSNE